MAAVTATGEMMSPTTHIPGERTAMLKKELLPDQFAPASKYSVDGVRQAKGHDAQSSRKIHIEIVEGQPIDPSKAREDSQPPNEFQDLPLKCADSILYPTNIRTQFKRPGDSGVLISPSQEAPSQLQRLRDGQGGCGAI